MIGWPRLNRQPERFSMLELFDAVSLADTRTTTDGYLVADARIARVGVQVYLGRELGRPDLNQVRVLRPESEVFSQDAMSSFAHRPVTNDHPPVLVTSENWREFARGQTGGEILRDGGFLRVPLMLSDAAAIKAVQGGKRELSAGYTCDIDFTAGVTDEGEEYDAIQKNVRGNHLAIVKRGRAGSACRIGDEETENNEETSMITMVVDGLTVETTEAGEAVLKQLATKLTDASARVDAKDGEIAALNASHAAALAALQAQVPTATMLDAAITARLAVIDSARKLLGSTYDASGKTDGEIRRAAVAAKLGDAKLEGKSDDYVLAAFDTLTSVAVATPSVDPLRNAILNTKPIVTDASMSAYDEYCAELRNAHKSTHTIEETV